MRKEWKITFEIHPMRDLYEEVVSANTQKAAIEFLECINNHQIRILEVKEIAA